MEEQVGPMHMAEMGRDAVLPTMGYPDMGAGRYSKMLSYGDWFRFNCSQRVHANSIEHLAWSLPMLLIGGLFFPRLATGLGSTILVGRELYRFGYMSPDGPNSHIREAGAIPLNIAEIIMLVRYHTHYTIAWFRRCRPQVFLWPVYEQQEANKETAPLSIRSQVRRSPQ